MERVHFIGGSPTILRVGLIQALSYEKLSGALKAIRRSPLGTLHVKESSHV